MKPLIIHFLDNDGFDKTFLHQIELELEPLFLHQTEKKPLFTQTARNLSRTSIMQSSDSYKESLETPLIISK